eukprot:NODE_945_length_1662_cov_18.862368_g776_i0.p2 GENE.NODE_945_length_1662_cov_18.862368_g776_i0~~NODE_945_length_1662_cov_18.862368_g776_i0.p2  ORF type:complete len:350 (-),score=67.33 NODE_945_length_1662_cov_18.862368_g776_i0:81-1130(-)
MSSSSPANLTFGFRFRAVSVGDDGREVVCLCCSRSREELGAANPEGLEDGKCVVCKGPSAAHIPEARLAPLLGLWERAQQTATAPAPSPKAEKVAAKGGPFSAMTVTEVVAAAGKAVERSDLELRFEVAMEAKAAPDAGPLDALASLQKAAACAGGALTASANPKAALRELEVSGIDILLSMVRAEVQTACGGVFVQGKKEAIMREVGFLTTPLRVALTTLDTADAAAIATRSTGDSSGGLPGPINMALICRQRDEVAEAQAKAKVRAQILSLVDTFARTETRDRKLLALQDSDAKRQRVACAKCGRQGHDTAQCRSGGPAAGRPSGPPGPRTCWGCGQSGHLKAQCTK